MKSQLTLDLLRDDLVAFMLDRSSRTYYDNTNTTLKSIIILLIKLINSISF